MRAFYSFLSVLLLTDYFAQKNTSYFDANGDLTYIQSAVYYRKSTDTLNFYRSYYTKTKKPFFQGYIIQASDSTDKGNKYTGTCKWFHENGNLKTIANYNAESKLNGIKQEYNSKGNLVSECTYSNGINPDKSYHVFDKNGIEYRLIDEDFNNNLLNWKFVNTEKCSSRIRIGQLEVINKSDKPFIVDCPIAVDSSNYSVELAIKRYYETDKNLAGILFDYKDPNNYRFFEVTRNTVFIGAMNGGKKTYDIKDYFSASFNSKEVLTTIRISKSRDSMYFFINNFTHIALPHNTNHSPKLALYCDPGVVYFDYVKLALFKPNYNNDVSESIFSSKKIALNERPIINGLIINDKGYVVAPKEVLIKDTDMVAGVYVNDTLVYCKADVVYKPTTELFCLLKLKLPANAKLAPVAYYCSQQTGFDQNEKYYAGSYFNYLGNYIFKKFTQSFEPDNKDVMEITYNLSRGISLFDKNGDFTGMFMGINSAYKPIILRAHAINDVLIHFYDIVSLQKPSTGQKKEFNESYYKNVVFFK